MWMIKLVKYKKKAEMLKQNVLFDKFQMYFKIENTPKPQRQVACLVNNFLCLKKENDEACHLSPDEYQKLEFIYFLFILFLSLYLSS